MSSLVMSSKHPKSPPTRLLLRAFYKENKKIYTFPVLLRRESTGKWWILSQRISHAESGSMSWRHHGYTVYPKKYAHGFVVFCFVVVMQSFIINSYEVFIHIHQGCFAGTGAIVRLPQCQWSKPDGYGKNQSMYNHNKAQQSKNRVHISWDILYNALAIQGRVQYLLIVVCSVCTLFCIAVVGWRLRQVLSGCCFASQANPTGMG